MSDPVITEGLEDVPDWARKAHAEACKPGAKSISNDEVVIRLARYHLAKQVKELEDPNKLLEIAVFLGHEPTETMLKTHSQIEPSEFADR